MKFDFLERKQKDLKRKYFS